MGFEPIILIFLILILIWALLSVFRIVPEYERLVVLSLGRYAGTRGPGFTIVLPLIETARKVDLRERFLEIPRQTAISRDNTSIDIDFLVYYRVVNPKLAILEIENFITASLNIAAT